MPSSSFAFLRRWDLAQPLRALCANRQGHWFAMACENGALALLQTDDVGEDPQIIKTFEGGFGAMGRDADNHAFLCGDAQGRLVIAEPHVPIPTSLIAPLGQPILFVASTREGLRACASKETLYLLGPEGAPLGDPLPLPHPPTALSFGPKGLLLAACQGTKLRLFDAHSLQTPTQEISTDSPIKALVWRSDRLRLFTLLETNQILTWAIDPETLTPVSPEFFSGIGAEETLLTLGLTDDDRFLIASGGPQLLCWPLESAAPWQTPPMRLGEPGLRRVSAFASNPRDPLLAVGYDDGAIILAPLDGRREIVVFPPTGSTEARVIGLVWNRDGDSFHAALENGHVFLFTLKSVTRFIKEQML